MRYAEARKLLLGAVESEHIELSVQPDELELVVLLSKYEAVHLNLGITLLYGRKRGHTSLAIHPFYWVAGLITHPTDEHALQQFEGMPPKMKRKLLALRQRLNGRVPITESRVPDLCFEERIDGWSTEEFLDHLLLSFAASHELAAAPLPAKGAQEFLEWYRAGEARARSFPIPLHNTWRVAGSSASERAA